MAPVDDGTNAYLPAKGVQAAIDGSGATSYTLSDALGSVRDLTDASGSPSGSTDYDSFGTVRSQAGASLPLGFTGELTDPTTGFLDLRARDLDPALGRFLSRDSVSPNAPGSQGCNPYAYVANNPTTWTDPTGQSIRKAISGFFLLASACVLTNWCAAPLLDGIARLGSGDWRVMAGGFAESAFAVVACALSWECDLLSQDIGLVIRTYGSTGTSTGGTNAPSPETCVMGAIEGVKANAEAGADSPAYVVQGAIRGCIQATAAAIRTQMEASSLQTDPVTVPVPTVPGKNCFKPFTKSNYRSNLICLTGGQDPGTHVQAHHIFPQKFEPWFAKRGLNINDPHYLTWVDGPTHVGWSRAWQQAWEEFMTRNRNATRPEILEEGRTLAARYGLSVNY